MHRKGHDDRRRENEIGPKQKTDSGTKQPESDRVERMPNEAVGAIGHQAAQFPRASKLERCGDVEKQSDDTHDARDGNRNGPREK